MNNPRHNPYRLIRIARDMRCKELSEKLSVTKSQTNMIDNGKKEPPLKRITEYADALRVDVNLIFRIRDLCEEDHSWEYLLMRTLEEIIKYDKQQERQG